MALLRHALCFVLGAAVGLGNVLVHRSAFPLGLLLAALTTFAVAWWLLRSRWPRSAASYVVGWLGMLALVAVGRPEGDYALAADLAGFTMLASGLMLIAVGVVAVAGRGSDT